MTEEKEEALRYYDLIVSEIQKRTIVLEELQAVVNGLRAELKKIAIFDVPKLVSARTVVNMDKEKDICVQKLKKKEIELKTVLEDLNRAQQRKIEAILELESLGVSINEER